MNAAARRLHRRHRLARRLRRFGAGVALGVVGLIAAVHGGPTLSVQIPGATAAPHEPAPDARADDPGDDEPRAAKTETQDKAKAAEPAPPLRGDASLRAVLDLSDASLEDGRYVVPAGKGRRLVLTLDPEVQAAAEKALSRAKAPRGAIVVMAVDGRILALAGLRDGDRETPRLGRDLDLPLSVWAPAASVFKIITAAALVTAGVGPDRKVCYHGGLRSVETSNLVDDKARDNQCGTLTDGVSRSQNAIIAKLSHRHINPRALRAMAAAFGFGEAPEMALDVEPSRASIPDEKLDFARVAAGFWNTELSPLGGALVANTVASGGLRVTPYIVDSVITGDRTVSVAPAPSQRVLKKHVAAKVARMMTATTESGTAFKGFHDRRRRPYLAKVDVAGKTGTLVRSTPSYLEYSWFVGFAPSDEPQVSISVLLGNPPRWHLKAHTAARMVLQSVF
ncbi:penicillin-binding transpeptidase domain-containing protein [Haliangium sp.]|uniref:penicillin-binding transpeptidase domain-containing protein n=1 Tax=Haliangium sp. TaxID=2663208 RepID=UPI003D0BD29A